MRLSLRLLGLVVFTTSLLVTIREVIVTPALADTKQFAQTTGIENNRRNEAARFLRQGIQQLEAQQLEAAQESLEAALEQYQALGDRAGEGQVYKNLGNLYYLRNDYETSLRYQQQALAIAQEIQDPDLEARALNNIGNIYTARNELDLAIRSYQDTLQILSEIPNPEVEIITLRNLVNIYYGQNQTEDLLPVSEQLLTISQSQENIEAETIALVALVVVHQSLEELDKARTYADQASMLFQSLENQEILLRTFVPLLNFYDTTNDVENVIELSESALELANSDQNVLMQIFALNALGITYERVGSYVEATEAATSLLEIAQRIQNKETEASAFVILGDIYDSQENYQEAIAAAEKALDLAVQIGNPELEARALAVIASASFSIELYREAIAAAEKSIEISQELELTDVLVSAWLSLAFAYVDLGDFEEYFQASREAVSLLESNELDASAVALIKALDTTISSIYLISQEQYQEVVESLNTVNIDVLESSLPEFQAQQLKGIVQLLFAIGYGGLQEYEVGLNSASSGLDIFRESQSQELQGTSLFLMGGFYRRTDELELALASYQEALALDNTYYAQAGLARTYRDLGMTRTAISHYKQAINAIESIRTNVSDLDIKLQQSTLQAFVDFDGLRVSDVYRELADLLLSQGRIPEAQQVLDLLKIEELNEFTQGTRATLGTEGLQYTDLEQPIVDAHGSLIALGQKLYNCQQTNCEQLNRLFDQQEQLTAQYNQQVEAFEAVVRDNRFDDELFQSPDNLSGEAQELLAANPDSVLIYPFVTDDKLWLLWASVGGVVGSVEVNVTQDELSRTVQRFGELLTSGTSLPQLQTTSQQLYRWLISPLEVELQANGIKNLIFVSDRVTRYIPVAALFDGEKFLIERYTISTVLSPALTDTQERLSGTASSRVLGLGLTQPVSGFDPLPAVEQELDFIVQSDETDPLGIYPGQVHLNNAFTLERMKENVINHRVLHVATHAAFVPGQPEASFIVLGNGEQMRIDDIEAMGTRLSNLHLVVLSACQTALGGEAGDGSEIAGISSYFLEKGRAEAVIASLWSVNDTSTSLLMQRFYALLATGDFTKAEALRQAQLSLLYDENLDALETRLGQSRGGILPQLRARDEPPIDLGYSHPYYWAPFILIGNGL